MELSVAANIAEIIGAGSILTGLMVGWFQVRQYRTQQRDAVARDLAQTFYNPVLARAISLIQGLPDDLSLEEVRAMGKEYVEAANTVTTSFETVGLLVYKKIAPFDLVVDLLGGICVTMNRKLRRFQTDLRIELAQPSWAEWFEWLGDQIVAVKPHRDPAHVRHQDWTP